MLKKKVHVFLTTVYPGLDTRTANCRQAYLLCDRELHTPHPRHKYGGGGGMPTVDTEVIHRDLHRTIRHRHHLQRNDTESLQGLLHS